MFHIDLAGLEKGLPFTCSRGRFTQLDWLGEYRGTRHPGDAALVAPQFALLLTFKPVDCNTAATTQRRIQCLTRDQIETANLVSRAYAYGQATN